MTHLTRPKLIALHTDIAILRDIAEIAAPHFETIRVRDVGRALAICQEDADARAFIAEHAIHSGTGASIFDHLKDRCPTVRRVMLTAYNDLTTIVNGLHTGAIQYLAQTPLNHDELRSILNRIAASPLPAHSPNEASPTRLSA